MLRHHQSLRQRRPLLLVSMEHNTEHQMRSNSCFKALNTGHTGLSSRSIPTYIVDLTEPPAEQYAAIFSKYKTRVKSLVDEVEDEMMRTVKEAIGSTAYTALQASLAAICKVLPMAYKAELNAFASGFEVPLEKVETWPHSRELTDNYWDVHTGLTCG